MQKIDKDSMKIMFKYTYNDVVGDLHLKHIEIKIDHICILPEAWQLAVECILRKLDYIDCVPRSIEIESVKYCIQEDDIK